MRYESGLGPTWEETADADSEDSLSEVEVDTKGSNKFESLSRWVKDCARRGLTGGRVVDSLCLGIRAGGEGDGWCESRRAGARELDGLLDKTDEGQFYLPHAKRRSITSCQPSPSETTTWPTGDP